jgi:glycine/D-amino acid oxidase-like deaminating enzyme
MKIVVVGGGVSGLTCAVALLEASRGDAQVVVLTAGAPAGTVSAVAGAIVGPVFWSWGCAADVVALCGLESS